MIKLIATDIDGTLLPEGTKNLNPEYFALIRTLHARGIRFAAASGRGFESVQNLMAPVKEEAILMAENGAYISENGKLLRCRQFEPGLSARIISFIRTLPSVRFYFTSTLEGAFTDTQDEEIIRSNEEGYQLTFHRAQDILKVAALPMKIAMYSDGDASKLAGPAREYFAGANVQIVESGVHWVDFIPEGASKGEAVAWLQERCGITREETIAFGDNNNDISLLQRAKESFAVAEAREELKKAAAHVIGSYREDSVLQTIRAQIPGL